MDSDLEGEVAYESCPMDIQSEFFLCSIHREAYKLLYSSLNIRIDTDYF